MRSSIKIFCVVFSGNIFHWEQGFYISFFVFQTTICPHEDFFFKGFEQFFIRDQQTVTVFG